MSWLDGLMSLFGSSEAPYTGWATDGYSLMGGGSDYWSGGPTSFDAPSGYDISLDPSAMPMSGEPNIDISGNIDSGYLDQMAAPNVTRTDTSMGGKDPFGIRDSFRDPKDPFGFKGGLPSLGDALDSLSGSGGGSGGGAGGGGNAFVMPRFETPQAAPVPRLGYEAPQAPTPIGFQPTNVDVLPKSNDLSGLAALLRGR